MLHGSSSVSLTKLYSKNLLELLSFEGSTEAGELFSKFIHLVIVRLQLLAGCLKKVSIPYHLGIFTGCLSDPKMDFPRDIGERERDGEKEEMKISERAPKTEDRVSYNLISEVTNAIGPRPTWRR